MKRKFPILHEKIKWKLTIFFIFFILVIGSRLGLAINLLVSFQRYFRLDISLVMSILLLVTEISPSFLLVLSYLILRGGSGEEAVQDLESRLTEDFMTQTGSTKNADLLVRRSTAIKRPRDTSVNRSKIGTEASFSQNSSHENQSSNLKITEVDNEDSYAKTQKQPPIIEDFHFERGNRGDDANSRENTVPIDKCKSNMYYKNLILTLILFVIYFKYFVDVTSQLNYLQIVI